MKPNHLILFSIFCWLFSTVLPAQNILYVDWTATGNNDGTSWEDAYTNLQDALANDEHGDAIWLAAGTYRPAPADGSTAATFTIDKDIHLLGGFDGTETNAEDRDPDLNVTELSGDLNSNDIENNWSNFRSDNVTTVMTISGAVSGNALLDGITIRNGHADGPGSNHLVLGGGAFILGAPQIQNVHFSQNYSWESGGGIYLFQGAKPTFEDCLFTYNASNRGGAIGSYGVEILISNCTFKFNKALSGPSMAEGGALGLYMTRGLIQDCLFSQNDATAAGGAILSWSPPNALGETLEILNCDFIDNSANLNSGALAVGVSGDNINFLVNSCLFEDNHAPEGGSVRIWIANESNEASVLVDGCNFNNNFSSNSGASIASAFLGKNIDVQINNNTFMGNETYNGGTVDLWGTSFSTGLVGVDNCFFSNNTAGEGGGISAGNGYGTNTTLKYHITNSHFSDNVADRGGAIALWCKNSGTTDVLIEVCVLENNQAVHRGGAMVLLPETDKLKVNLSRCYIQWNESPLGGAIYGYLPSSGWPVFSGQYFIMANNLVTGNQSSHAVIQLDSMVGMQVINNTIAHNSGHGIDLGAGSHLELQNTILFNPDYDELVIDPVSAEMISLGSNMLKDASLLDPHDSDLLSVSDPVFMETYDFHLQETSPGVDAGYDHGNLTAFDLDGNPRVVHCVDIGAYESTFVGTGDCLTATNEVTLDQSLLVFPNPVTTVLQLQLPDGMKMPIFVEVLDLQGIIRIQQVLKEDASIQVNTLTPGMYWVRVVQSERIYGAKFVKN